MHVLVVPDCKHTHTHYPNFRGCSNAVIFSDIFASVDANISVLGPAGYSDCIDHAQYIYSAGGVLYLRVLYD